MTEPTEIPVIFTRRQYYIQQLMMTGINQQVAENIVQDKVDEQPDLDWDKKTDTWDNWSQPNTSVKAIKRPAPIHDKAPKSKGNKSGSESVPEAPRTTRTPSTGN